MIRLGHDTLFAACRSLYTAAGRQLVLPPLTRDAGSSGEAPARSYELPAGPDVIVLRVELDEAYADRNLSPEAGIPVRLEIALRRAGTQGVCTLDACDSSELIRAFWLGAQLPILIEPASDGRNDTLSIQLAERFSFSCGAIRSGGEPPGADAMCEMVSRAINELSQRYFMDRQNGLAVWHMRAAQELFGDPRPAAETFWPLPSADPASAAAQTAALPAVVREAPRRRSSSWPYALAASVAMAACLPFAFPSNSGAGADGAKHFAGLPPVKVIQAAGTASPVAPPPPAMTEKATEPSSTNHAQTAMLEDGEVLAEPTPASVVQPVPVFAQPSKLPAVMTAEVTKPKNKVTKAKRTKPAAVAQARQKRKKQDSNFRFANPLPVAGKAVAKLTTDVVKGIEKLPVRIAALVKPQN